MAEPTNLMSWFGNKYTRSDWHDLPSGKKERYREEYLTWVESMKVTEPVTPTVGEEVIGSVAPTVTPTGEVLPTTEVLPIGLQEPLVEDELKPTFGEGAAEGIPKPEVIPAPAYEITPEQQEMQDLYGGKITDWVEAGGYGLDPETQAQMIQLQTDTLKARETESVRVMKNNMERRGITNSGFLQAAENQIHSNTSVAIAGAIADVQIKSALMKMASFETAMGQMGQFLGYLSEQSQLAYAPEFATWQAEQLATMQHWQGQMDILKIDLNQAYQTQNIELQAKLTSQLAEQQHGYDLQMAEMELEAMNQQAASEGAGSIWGTLLEGVFTIAAITL